jgi:hypothetical protein
MQIANGMNRSRLFIVPDAAIVDAYRLVVKPAVGKVAWGWRLAAGWRIMGLASQRLLATLCACVSGAIPFD